MPKILKVLKVLLLARIRWVVSGGYYCVRPAFFPRDDAHPTGTRNEKKTDTTKMEAIKQKGRSLVVATDSMIDNECFLICLQYYV